MEMKLEILEDDPKLEGVVGVRVPGIYGRKGAPLPKRLAKLVRPAAAALQRAYREIVREGGHLYLTDMFRSAAEQQRTHEDWKLGRKTAYSPPSCRSIHEAARAIDIHHLDTGIGHRRVREILNKHGWVNIVETLTGDESWHYEFRGPAWESYRNRHGYAAMAQAMKAEIGNRVKLPQTDRAREEVRWLQGALNEALGTNLPVDGIYGPQTKAAVRTFQTRHGLQVDGYAGPITTRKLREVIA